MDANLCRERHRTRSISTGIQPDCSINLSLRWNLLAREVAPHAPCRRQTRCDNANGKRYSAVVHYADWVSLVIHTVEASPVDRGCREILPLRTTYID